MKQPDSFAPALVLSGLWQLLLVAAFIALVLALGGCHPEPAVTPTTPAPAATFDERYPALPDASLNLPPLDDHD